MEVDFEKLKARANDVHYAVARIRTYAGLPEKEFWQDERNLFTVKYLLLQAIEAIGSICVHVLAKKFQMPVSSYAACFAHLGSQGVLPLGSFHETPQDGSFPEYLNSPVLASG